MRKRECGMPKAISKCENIRNSPGHLSMKLSGFVLPISIFMMNETPIHKPPNELRIDVEASTNAEAQFNAPPHQSELN
jgi:hypothetical protein